MKKNKFRAWHKEKKCWMSLHNNGYSFNPNNGQIYYEGLNITSRIDLMQYTGLKDKNDKEIYEGDIVKYLDGNEWSTESGYDCEEFNNHGAIFFDEECGRYDVTNKQGIGYDDLFDCGVDFEIIGNIYENPELVKN
ncbi:YopX family protein [Bacillus cereus]|uniref:YopX family protein n=1 Tax=Bacillus cereus TaxID=1396 RepID=UPI001E2B9893|nr:YopX family protein [Bacillus cereus]MCU5617028.1 YopX family protein [Bacillus cereus]